MRKKAVCTFDEKGIMFEYETEPSFLDIIGIIEKTADATISDIVGYAPYLTNYMIRYNIIQELSDIALPEDINDCYLFVNDSDAWDIMMQDLSEVYNFVDENVRELVKFKKKQLLRQSKIDGLIDAATHLIENVGKQFEGLDIKELLERLEKAGINPNLSEEKVVQAILEYHKEEDEKANVNSV